MNNQTEKIKPITRCLMTIGQLPSSYLVAMTYEEQLIWLCRFLQEEVIPKTNENIEVVNQLVQYITDYFNNLDLQDEVNTKLDEMAESGQLEEIISTYLNSNAIFCYDTIADLKSATNLINGSFARTIGYSNKNDGGGELYFIRNRAENENEDGVTTHILNDDTLVAELTNAESGKFIRTEFMNLSSGTTESDSINNYNKIYKVLNKGYNITFTSNYYIKNANQVDTYSVNRKTCLYGESDGAGLTFYSNNVNYLFDIQNGDIDIKNITFNNASTSYRAQIIKNITKASEKYKYGNINVENCRFNGLIELLTAYQDTDHIFPAGFDWGMGEVNVLNCTFENVLSTFIDISRMPSKYITFNDNRVHNFSYALVKIMWNIVDDGDDTDTIIHYRTYIDGVIAKNNYITNDNNVFGVGNLYYSVVACKCREVIIENNYVENMKSLDSDTTVNPFYLIAEEVIVKNNVCKNNINFTGNENKVIKSKAGLNSRKTYINNSFILEKTFLSTINSSLANPYSESDLITNCTCQLLQNIVHTEEFNVSNNVFEIPYISNQTTSSDIAHFIFNGNTIICDRWKGYLLRPTETNSTIEFNDNIIEISTKTSDAFAIVQADFALPNSKIYFNNNNIKCNNDTINILSLTPPAAQSGATIAAKLLIAQNNNIYNYGTPSSSNSLFNVYRGKFTDSMIFKNNYYYTNGKERYYRITLSDKPMIYELLYEGTLFNDATALQNSIIQFDTYPYTSSQKYKLSIEYDDTAETKLYYYFTLYAQDGQNYIKYIKDGESTETSTPVNATPSVTAYIRCENVPSVTELVRLAIGSNYNQIRLNNALFASGYHKVKITLETV